MKKVLLGIMAVTLISSKLLGLTMEEKKANIIEYIDAINSYDIEEVKKLKTKLHKEKSKYNTEEMDIIKTFNEVSDALIAEDAGDKELFIKKIKNAYWIAPAGFASMVETYAHNYKQKEKLAKLVIPMNEKIKTSQGKTVTLADYAKGKKAILIDFWASWCGPCMRLMPELKKKGDTLSIQGIAVLGMNTENNAETAEEVKNNNKMTIPWLVEPKSKIFSKMLEIDSIPRMILLTPDGKVLFNGHPQDKKLTKILNSL